MSKGRSHDLNALGLAIRSLDDSPLMKAVRDLENGSAMRAIRDLENNSAIRALRDMESSPTARMIRDLENNPAMRAVRDMQAQFGKSRSTMRMVSESISIQREMMKKAGQTTRLAVDQFNSPLRELLRQFQDTQRQFNQHDGMLRSISPLQKMVGEASELARNISAAMASQSRIDPAVFVGAASLAEQLAAVSGATSDAYVARPSSEAATISEQVLRWDQKPTAIQVLYIFMVLQFFMTAWQFISDAVSSNEIDKVNQHLSKIVEQLHQLDPGIGRDYVTTKNTRLRSGPSKNDALILTLPTSTTVTITGSEGDWLGGVYTNDAGVQQYGWIYRKNLIRKSKPSSPPHP